MEGGGCVRGLALVFGLLSAFLLVLAPAVDTLLSVPPNSPWQVTEYTLTYGLDVTNLGYAPASNATVKIGVIRDFLPFQDVLSSVPLTPPQNASTDSWNNSYVLHRLSPVQPGETRQFLIRTTVRLHSIDFAVADGTPSLSRTSHLGPYLQPEEFIESNDTNIIGRAQALSVSATNAHAYAFNAFQYTTAHLSFVEQPEERGAAFALKSRAGEATEYADLYVALLRARAIPAGRLNGFAGDLQTGAQYFGEELSHVWARVHYSNVGWVPSDPTFGDRQFFENFERSDGSHVVVTEGVGRKFSFLAWNRTLNPGANLQGDYHVVVESKTVQSLSISRDLVFVSFFALPSGLIATIAVGVWRERRMRKRIPPAYEDE